MNVPELMAAYRTGDAEAQQELLTKLETALRSIVRQLSGKQIRSERESMDICQSLMLAFHLRARDGKVLLDSEEAMRAYLKAMIRHKLANLSDRIRAQKRGSGKAPADIADVALPVLDPTASMVAGTAEMRRTIEDALTPDELAILSGRLAGRTNLEIAAEMGKTPDSVRMEWNRARQKLQDRGLIR